MILGEKTANLLTILLDEHIPLTSAKLAQKTDISQRSILKYLKEIRDVADEFGFELVNKPGVGVYIDASIEEKAQIRSSMKIEIDHSFSYQFRKEYIIGVLVKNSLTYTIQNFADDLFVSKSIITKDLDKIEAILAKFNVRLIRRQNFGLALEGEEMDIRNAVMAQRVRNWSKEAFYNLRRPEGLDQRIRLHTWNTIHQLYPEYDVIAIQNILLQVDTYFGKQMTDISFAYLIEYVILMLTRIKIGKCITEDEVKNTFDFNEKEFSLARTVFDEIGEKHQIQISDAECIRFMVCLRCLDHQITDDELSEMFSHLEPRFVDMAKQLICMVEQALSVTLKNDVMLLQHLAVLLSKISLRHYYGIVIRSVIHDEIKEIYSGMIGICLSAKSLIAEIDRLNLNENDMVDLAVIFCNAAARAEKKTKTLMLASGNQTTINYIKHKITKAIPELMIASIIGHNEASESDLSAYDLVICIDGLIKRDNAIIISSRITDEEISKIRSKILSQNQPSQNDIAQLKGVLDKLIVYDCDCKTKDEAIETGCKILFKAEKVKPGFKENVLYREEVASTAIGNGVAIPHSISDYVNSFGMCLVRLKKPVQWTDEDKVDLIFVLALKQDERFSWASFFGRFYAVVDNKGILENIRSESNPSIIEKYFLNNKELIQG